MSFKKSPTSSNDQKWLCYKNSTPQNIQFPACRRPPAVHSLWCSPHEMFVLSHILSLPLPSSVYNTMCRSFAHYTPLVFLSSSIFHTSLSFFCSTLFFTALFTLPYASSCRPFSPFAGRRRTSLTQRRNTMEHDSSEITPLNQENNQVSCSFLGNWSL